MKTNDRYTDSKQYLLDRRHLERVSEETLLAAAFKKLHEEQQKGKMGTK